MPLVWMLKYSNCYISIMFLCLIKGENGEDCKCVESKQARNHEREKERSTLFAQSVLARHPTAEWMSLNCTWLTPTYCIPPNMHCC